MGFRNTGLRAIVLATLIALAGVSVHTAPVAATDPAPTSDPAATPAPDATATASPAPDATATASPAPDATATASPASTSDPAATASPAPTTDPAVTPAPEVSPLPVTAATVTVPAAKPDLGARIARIAIAQRHKRYVRGASGPWAFDCSGLVRYAYRVAGISSRLGGGHSARGMLLWARFHHLTSRTNPKIGDVVIYGNGTHAAIYIGGGRVISALNPRAGIRITRLHALTSPFTTFIHTRH